MLEWRLKLLGTFLVYRTHYFLNCAVKNIILVLFLIFGIVFLHSCNMYNFPISPQSYETYPSNFDANIGNYCHYQVVLDEIKPGFERPNFLILFAIDGLIFGERNSGIGYKIFGPNSLSKKVGNVYAKPGLHELKVHFEYGDIMLWRFLSFIKLQNMPCKNNSNIRIQVMLQKTNPFTISDSVYFKISDVGTGKILLEKTEYKYHSEYIYQIESTP